MKKLFAAVCIIVFLFSFAPSAFSAEAFTCSVEQVKNSSKLRDVVLTWTTAADTSFVARALSSYLPTMNSATGYPVYVQYILTDPVDAPTDNYDLSFTSTAFPGNVDIFGQAVYNRDDTNTEMVEPAIPYISVDLTTVTFDVLNAGATKSGIVRIRCILAE